MHQAERPPRNSKILGKNRDRIAVNGSGAYHHTVAGKDLFIHSEITGIMLHEHVIFIEAAGIKDGHNALTGSVFSHGLLLHDGLLTPAKKHLFALLPELTYLLFQ